MSTEQDWSVDDDPADDPDSTADGMPRPDLSGIPDETPIENGSWSPDGDERESGADTATYVLPEIVPATEHGPAQRATEPAQPAEAAQPAVAPAPTSAWHEHLPTVAAPPSQLRAPGRRPRVRRVTRVVRHIDPWSTFKIGLIFSLVAYVVGLTSGVLLWRVADATGTIDNVERWFTQFGWETFEFKGGEIFHNAWIIGLFGVVAMTGGLVLLATLFNLVSDIVGGIRVTVLEEEVVERTISSARRFVVRRPPATAQAGTTADPTWGVDDEPSAGPSAPSPSGPDGAEWSVDD